MLILGIETSCDETASAVVKNGREVISSCVAAQVEVHRKYSGVVPELASRAHVTSLNAVVEQATRKTGFRRIDAIAVTIGPGLAGSLLVGRMTAEALGWVFQKPVLGVNHIEGHLLSPVLIEKRLAPPFLGLVVSGGHTDLVVAKRWDQYRLIGRTRDDAAGEAFDKVAKMLALGYPGGPLIDRLAKKGRAERCPFPRPWLPGSWDFSFSGLKTAVLYKLREKKSWTSREKWDMCAGFQQAVVEVLVGKTVAAAKIFGLSRVVVGGGVAANSQFRHLMERRCRSEGLRLAIAPLSLCTDNAAMIASAAFFKMKSKTHKRSMGLKVIPTLHIPFQKEGNPSFSPTEAGIPS